MRHLSGSDIPRYVSDRLSAVSNVPMQFLVSAGMVATILAATSFADFLPGSDGAAGLVDAQKTASINATARKLTTGNRGWHATDPCLRSTALQTLVTE